MFFINILNKVYYVKGKVKVFNYNQETEVFNLLKNSFKNYHIEFIKKFNINEIEFKIKCRSLFEQKICKNKPIYYNRTRIYLKSELPTLKKNKIPKKNPTLLITKIPKNKINSDSKSFLVNKICNDLIYEFRNFENLNQYEDQIYINFNNNTITINIYNHFVSKLI